MKNRNTIKYNSGRSQALSLKSLSSQVSQLSTLCLLERARQKFHRGRGVPRRKKKFSLTLFHEVCVHPVAPVNKFHVPRTSRNNVGFLGIELDIFPTSPR